jgi:hypothetical protein
VTQKSRIKIKNRLDKLQDLLADFAEILAPLRLKKEEISSMEVLSS